MFSRNLRKRSAKMIFLIQKWPKTGRPVWGSIKLPWIFPSIFSFLLVPFSRGKTGFFARLLLPGGPETRGTRRFFFFLGRNAGGIAFAAQNCCQTQGANGLQIFCCLFFVRFLCFRADPLEKEFAEARTEGREKQHKKEEEPEEEEEEEKRRRRRRTRSLFLRDVVHCSYFLCVCFCSQEEQEEEKKEEKKKILRRRGRTRRTKRKRKKKKKHARRRTRINKEKEEELGK